MRLSLPLAVALVVAVSDGQPSSVDPALSYPLIPSHGGVVPLPSTDIVVRITHNWDW